MSKWLPTIFKILLACIPIFSTLAAHNYNVPVKADAGVAEATFIRPALTHGMALLAASSVVGAAVVHHKLNTKAAATIPTTIVAHQADDLQKLFDLLWIKMGPSAGPDQVKAIQDLQTAMKGKPS